MRATSRIRSIEPHKALLALALLAGLVVLVYLVAPDPLADLMKTTFAPKDEAGNAIANPFTEVSTGIADIAGRLMWISLAILPLGATAGVIMLTAGLRGMPVVVGALAGPIMLLVVQGIAA